MKSRWSDGQTRMAIEIVIQILIHGNLLFDSIFENCFVSKSGITDAHDKAFFIWLFSHAWSVPKLGFESISPHKTIDRGIGI